MNFEHFFPSVAHTLTLNLQVPNKYVHYKQLIIVRLNAQPLFLFNYTIVKYAFVMVIKCKTVHFKCN